MLAKNIFYLGKVLGGTTLISIVKRLVSYSQRKVFLFENIRLSQNLFTPSRAAFERFCS